MSRTLGRIRKATGDPILVRSGHTMVPTAHALALREEVHELVHRAHGVLSSRREIDLATLERVFTVRWHDALTAACGPALVAAVHRRAPGYGCGSSRSPPPTPPSCGAARSTWPPGPPRRRRPTSTAGSSVRIVSWSRCAPGIRSPRAR